MTIKTKLTNSKSVQQRLDLLADRQFRSLHDHYALLPSANALGAFALAGLVATTGRHFLPAYAQLSSSLWLSNHVSTQLYLAVHTGSLWLAVLSKGALVRPNP